MKLENISTTEVIILIVCVALFIAIAIPSYMEYAVRKRMQDVWSAVELVKNNAIDHFKENNDWPNATQLGFSAANDTDLDQPKALHKYALAFSISPQTVGTCDVKVLSIRWALDHRAIGMRQTSSYIAELYLGAMPSGYIGSMCHESFNGISFGNTYLGDVCTYNDHESFATALCNDLA